MTTLKFWLGYILGEAIAIPIIITYLYGIPMIPSLIICASLGYACVAFGQFVVNKIYKYL